MTDPADPIDLGALSTRFERIAPDAARRIAQEHYGMDGALTRLDTEKDDTFRIDSPAGRHILKIANPGESHGELDLQVSALRHIEIHAPDLPVPRVIADRAGNRLPLIGGRYMRLMTFLPGTVLDTVTPTAEERREIGRVLARLRLAMAGFEHPGARHTLAWDVRHLPALAPLLAHVTDRGQRVALSAGLARFTALKPRIDALPRQILHNDFSRSNIVIARPGPRVTGIIDFGDVVETAVAIDVSTAMLNQLPRDPAPDILAPARELLDGYLEYAPLSIEERVLLPHLVMGRIVTRALLSLWRAATFPENAPYILRNTEQGWSQLDWFLARDPDTLSAYCL